MVSVSVVAIASLLALSRSEEHRVLAQKSACYDATSFVTDSNFNAPFSGELIGIELEFASGGITCDYRSYANTHWGCHYSNYDFMVQMIKEGANAGTYYPSGSTENVNSISNYGSCSNNCDVLRYSMNGYDSDSDTLRLVDTANPHTVSVDDTFSLQYSEGCCGSSTGDNSGTACADVYFLYSSYGISSFSSFYAQIRILLFIAYSLSQEPEHRFLAKESACYSARQFATGYTFNAPYDGELIGVELEYVSGYVDCGWSSTGGTNWGCAGISHSSMINVVKEGDITETFYPTDSTEDVTINARYSSCSGGCDVHSYSMDGFHWNSEVLTLMDTANPHTVSVDDTFSLQYSEGCCGSSTGDNDGAACADVYFVYSSYGIIYCFLCYLTNLD